MATTFQYAVRDRTGKTISGELEGENTTAVAGRLRSMGYALISITKKRTDGFKMEITLPSMGSKVKLRDLAVFARQFATMINAGLSMLRSLTILADQTSNKELSRVLNLVRSDVEGGGSFSGSLAKHPRVFPPIMINMIRAGEIGGFLDQVMLQIASNFESEVRLRGRIKSAMTYPVVVLVLAILITIGMLLFIVPTFAAMFAGLGADLPAPTRILVAASDGLKIGFIPLVLLAIAAFAGWTRVKHTEQVRSFVDPIKLRVPVFGELFRKIALARFCRNFGTMLRSGVPILQSLDIVADTTGNMVITKAVRDIQESVRNGESLTGPLARHPVFPATVAQMMAVGEDTGNLDTMLAKISEFYDHEVEATTESLTALIEPLMIAFLGGLVGSMIVAMYMPIFKIFDLIGGSAK